MTAGRQSICSTGTCFSRWAGTHTAGFCKVASPVAFRKLYTSGAGTHNSGTSPRYAATVHINTATDTAPPGQTQNQVVAQKAARKGEVRHSGYVRKHAEVVDPCRLAYSCHVAGDALGTSIAGCQPRMAVVMATGSAARDAMPALARPVAPMVTRAVRTGLERARNGTGNVTGGYPYTISGVARPGFQSIGKDRSNIRIRV
jgi:microcompartment protein CcmK/EutM